MKRVAFYVRVSTMDQNPETQLRELREYAERRGLTVAREHEYVDHGVGGTKARRPALDRLLEDARRRRFDVLLVWSCDRLARSTKHFLQVLDELDSCGVQFVSLREAFDTSGALGRAFLGIVAVLGEMERALLIERVRSGMARARAEGRQIGRARLDVNREQVIRDRRSGMSLTQVCQEAWHLAGVGVQADERGNLKTGRSSSRARRGRTGSSQRSGRCSMNTMYSDHVGKVFVVVRSMR